MAGEQRLSKGIKQSFLPAQPISSIGTAFVADPRWYRVHQDVASRWDRISVVPKQGGGYYGYWTANPQQFHPGFGATDDGLDWTALPPPVVDWETHAAPPSLEIGRVAHVGRHYYLLGGIWGPYEGQRGMVTLVADHPEGLFRLAPHNFHLLTSSVFATYFARFCLTDDGMLANHHMITRDERRFFAPLKRASCLAYVLTT